MKLRLILVFCVVALVLVPAAFGAGGSAGNGYGGGGGTVQNQVSGAQGVNGTLAASGSKGALPFTGLDLGLLVAGGLVLIAVGAGIRRTTRNRA
jgi:hypothetical protein